MIEPTRLHRLTVTLHQTSPGFNAWRMNERNDHMAWTLLCIAGIVEIAFAFGMKRSEGFTKFVPALFTVVTGLSSVILLSISLRTLPVGTAYAVWTGIGAAGVAILGIALLGESASPMRILCIVLILAGVIGLKLVSSSPPPVAAQLCNSSKIQQIKS